MTQAPTHRDPRHGHARTSPGRLAASPLLVAVLVAAVSVLLGCEKLEERTKYLTGPEAFAWEDDSRFRVQGNDDMWGQANVYAAGLTVFVKGFPPNTTITAGDQTATVDSDGNAMLQGADIRTFLGSIPTNTLDEPHVDGATVTVQAPGLGAIDVPLPAMRYYGVVDILEDAASGPLLFAGETAQEGPVRNVIWFHSIRRTVIGADAPTLRDLDAIADVQRPAGTTRVCTGYTDEQGRAQPDVHVILKDTVITIRERRTGRAVATKRFGPVDECPTWLTAQQGRHEERVSVLPEEAMEQWLRSQIEPQPAG